MVFVRMNWRDSFAKSSDAFSTLHTFPLLASVECARYRRSLPLKSFLRDRLVSRPELRHLKFAQCPKRRKCPQCDVTLTRFRCKIPGLHFYLNHAGFYPSPMCSYCNQREPINHFFLECRDSWHTFTTTPHSLRYKSEIPPRFVIILSFGANVLGFHCSADRCTVHQFLLKTQRPPC